MLQSLKIQNVALIEEVEIEFQEGLNVLTGETGAGKSILVDSLGVILGARISPDLIRQETDELRVEGAFSLSPNHPLLNELAELDIPIEEDGSLILARRVNRNGKNSVRVNGWQVTVGTLKNIGRQLIQVHAQHDTLEIFSASFALDTLDQADESLKKVKDNYQKEYFLWKNLIEELEKLSLKEEGKKERLELITWQAREISEAELSAEEERELENYILAASNVGKISEGLAKSYSLLNQDDSSVLANLSRSIKEVSAASRYDIQLTEMEKELQNLFFQLEELALNLRSRMDHVEFDPFEFEKKQQRMEKIHQLKKKYGLEVPELIQKLADLLIEKDELENSQFLKDELENKIQRALVKVAEKGAELSKKRAQVAKKWQKEVEESIREMSMPEARFEVKIGEQLDWSLQGKDEVDFLFSANVGQGVQSLKKVASGGELSRVALAIQAVANFKSTTKTLIFDEIDTGIGGRTALAVGEKMKSLAQKNQILSITHLPQIAVFAETQFCIEKVVKKGKTYTEVACLSEEMRIDEIARMLSGEASQEIARKMAEDMLHLGRK